MLYIVVILFLLCIILILYYKLDRVQSGRRVSTLGFFKFYISKIKKGYRTIKAIFIKEKKQNDKTQWDKDNDDWGQEKPTKSTVFKEEAYLKEEEIKVLRKNLQISENKNKELQIENNDLSVHLEECKTKYEEQISDLSLKNKNIQNLLDEYKESISKVFPVSQIEVASVYCQEYQQIFSILENTYRRILGEIEKSDKSIFTADGIIWDYLCDDSEYFKDAHEIEIWYVILNYVSAVPNELTFDLKSRKTPTDQLSFLQQYTFEKYFRKKISSLVMFSEMVRVKLLEAKFSSNVTEIIQNMISELKQVSNIDVDYISIGTILNEKDFEKYEIETSSEETAENTVVAVRKYAVNNFSIDTPIEKTILEIKL